MKPTETHPALLVALRGLHQQVADLPGDDGLFSDLNPQQRRDAHALGCRLQDRIMGLLSRLVAELADDGADLIDEGGLPRSYGDGGSEA